MACGAIVSGFERALMNINNGYEIPTGLQWHSVNDVYILVNCDGQFHWVLAVVVLKKRLIRVYDSASGLRRKIYLGDEETDEETGSQLESKHPFLVEYVQDIIQQGRGALDCGLFVGAFAEFLSDEIPIQSNGFRSNYLRSRYATLLCKYDSQKAEAGYVSDNDDPSKPRGHFTPPDHDALVNLE
uniref:Ulp1 protease family, C-terminal catalytic domain containing protein n=1 Tax=Solanum tuberosum TaxID=4113 RepID=M1BV35_SOLTU